MKAEKIIRHFIKKGPYELTKKQERLPTATLDNVKLVLALYAITHRNPIFVQIGAYDGQTDDPVTEYVLAGKLKCVLVEPIESSFQKLKRVYEGVSNVQLVHAAISDSDGEATMYKVKPGSPCDNLRMGGLASFDKTHLLRHGVGENDMVQVQVPCLTLKSLLAKFGLPKIDILQIDTEGFDAEIVRMTSALDYSPGCMNFENTNLSAETKLTLYDSLTRRGYFFSHDRANTIAVHSRLMDGLLDLVKGRKTLPADF